MSQENGSTIKGTYKPTKKGKKKKSKKKQKQQSLEMEDPVKSTSKDETNLKFEKILNMSNRKPSSELAINQTPQQKTKMSSDKLSSLDYRSKGKDIVNRSGSDKSMILYRYEDKSARETNSTQSKALTQIH